MSRSPNTPNLAPHSWRDSTKNAAKVEPSTSSRPAIVKRPNVLRRTIPEKGIVSRAYPQMDSREGRRPSVNRLPDASRHGRGKAGDTFRKIL